MPNIVKTLIACPNCLTLGRRQILGEITDGYLKVMRFHNAHTMIRGEFEVMCDKCGEPVYFRTERKEETIGTVINYWSLGIFGQGSIAGTI